MRVLWISPSFPMRTLLMARYSKIKPDLLLNVNIDTQLRIMTSVCRIIAAPCSTERLMELLGCVVDKSEASWQWLVLYARLCVVRVALKGADLRSQSTQIAVPVPETC